MIAIYRLVLDHIYSFHICISILGFKMYLKQYSPYVWSKVPLICDASYAFENATSGKDMVAVLAEFRKVFLQNDLLRVFHLLLSHRHNNHGKVMHNLHNSMHNIKLSLLIINDNFA